ncbi:hypothetical protein EI534_12985 [Pseudomonas frederiksbergensis]|nr:hypothetical protein [Pseudomonas frederiksbergensis]
MIHSMALFREGCQFAGKSTSKHKTLVGASLLAMAECQLISMLNVRPLSRAGSLPQGDDVIVQLVIDIPAKPCK